MRYEKGLKLDKANNTALSKEILPAGLAKFQADEMAVYRGNKLYEIPKNTPTNRNRRKKSESE